MFKVSYIVLKNFSYTASAQIFIMVVSLLTSVFFARYFSVEEYGRYQLVISFMAIVSVITLPGFSLSAQLSIAKEKYGNIEIIFRKKLFYSFVGGIALVGIGLYYQNFSDNLEVAYMLYSIAIVYPFYNLRSIWESLFNGTYEYKNFATIQVLYALLGLLSLVITFLIFNNIYLIILLTFGSLGIANIIIINYFKNKSKNFIKDKELIKYGYKISFPIIITAFISLDKLIISEYLSISDVAIYGIAMIFPLIIKNIYSVLFRLISPSLSKISGVRQSWKYIKHKFLKIYILFIFLAIFGFFTIDNIIYLFYSDRYAESATYAKWIWLSISLSAPATYLTDILRIQKKLKFEYIASISNVLMKNISFLLLLPLFGLWGATYAVIIAYISIALLYTAYFIYEYKYENK